MSRRRVLYPTSDFECKSLEIVDINLLEKFYFEKNLPVTASEEEAKQDINQVGSGSQMHTQKRKEKN